MAWWKKIDEGISEVASVERASVKLIFSTLLLALAGGAVFAGYKAVIYFLAHKPWWAKFLLK